jgi:hypothetical protein
MWRTPSPGSGRDSQQGASTSPAPTAPHRMSALADGPAERPCEWPSCSPTERSSSIRSRFGLQPTDQASHARQSIAHVGSPCRRSPAPWPPSGPPPCAPGCPTTGLRHMSGTGPVGRRLAFGPMGQVAAATWKARRPAATHSTWVGAPIATVSLARPDTRSRNMICNGSPLGTHGRESGTVLRAGLGTIWRRRR